MAGQWDSGWVDLDYVQKHFVCDDGEFCVADTPWYDCLAVYPQLTGDPETDRAVLPGRCHRACEIQCPLTSGDLDAAYLGVALEDKCGAPLWLSQQCWNEGLGDGEPGSVPGSWKTLPPEQLAKVCQTAEGYVCHGAGAGLACAADEQCNPVLVADYFYEGPVPDKPVKWLGTCPGEQVP